ncbi:MAG: rRNA pseudouridine synthase [Clostridia bacterium]|nr:rRNA pseudouridine synthase [Clostridia bacterium]
MIRLDKYLSNSGVGSRKDIKSLVKKGLVTVDGRTVSDPGIRVDENTSDIRVENNPIAYKKYIYLMMNKPAGYVSATFDKHFPTVLDLLDEYCLSFKPFPAGRLDIDTEGFVLLTNDGDLSHRILSPKKHVKKTYMVVSDIPADASDITVFKDGVVLDDGYKTMSAQLAPDKDNTSYLTLQEGKFHQVKRMFEAVGKHVTYLKRISIGNLPLDESLAPGEYRELTEEEIKQLCEEI